MDIVSPSVTVTSIDGYDFSLAITDDASIYRWMNGLKKKSDADDAARNAI